MDSTPHRKSDHIRIVLEEDVLGKGVSTGFERLMLEHCALPGVDLDGVDLGLTLWDKSLTYPWLISSMTGGTPEAKQINLFLAEVAQALGIAMGLGSQRAAIENPDLAATYQVRSVAPDILLFANLGLVQLNYGYGLAEAQRAVAMIEADALILHLNPLQEAVQPDGDRRWSGLWSKLETLVRSLEVPVIVKEVGNGISGPVAKRLQECGVKAIDVAGAGGTSWSEVEAHRQTDRQAKEVAHNFADWGLPTALSLQQVVQNTEQIPIFASGGIRSGIDGAKAIALGATLVGSAAPVLAEATVNAQRVYDHYQARLRELQIAAFCCDAANLAQLAQVPLWDKQSGQRLTKP
ncbi:type 2 isopentenyl-diphosphate Delta-isomerase [Synechocystis sp. PCC 7339]|uniref:type 2 isopentenyl-diphosphate Delta-isomerase n=1 Tax=Synechocystis TaxID=1142 RepID=UPI00187EBC2E|nr:MULTISPECIES: type 2 isopentenyl-diphosphate Delta-isomerase [Synechocystis]MBE9203228.1 type 2 isopentenyl-diphosphate Delta-isomerase [Synechocystis salina LEGE 06099]UAJ72645.1 type 2 isopentenyl-diphosphate Delta-isomerase [Synechocystis sp. PCC 7339]